jgi:23S rRNA G2069 N7-methylase RlmK/C1962 C5-methylase RlmI
MPLPCPSFLRPRRYQLKRASARAVLGGHPWIFRGALSSAADVLRDGEPLYLVDGANQVLGFGYYESRGAIAIRVVKRGATPPGAAWLRHTVERAVERRAPLRAGTDAFRAIHGENDRLPGVVVDVYGRTAVLQTYARGADPLGRLCAGHVRRLLGLDTVLWKPALRRISAGPPLRRLWGPEVDEVTVREDDRHYTVPLEVGQKSGLFLDLRGLRRWLAGQELAGKRVLNLFAYTGTLGRCAEAAGAAQVWQVDASERALATGRSHHARDPARHHWIAADVFEWLPALDPAQRFDLIIVDPPQMTSRADQVGRALAAYRRLYRHALRHLAPGGQLVACCCTARISEAQLRAAVETGAPALRFRERLPVELDHPVRFREADYLKVLIYDGSPA